MQLTDREFRVLYTDYDIIIDGMRSKLLEAKKANPTKDFSDREITIDRLIALRELFHRMHHDSITLDNSSRRVMIERENLIRRIRQLEKENETLKQTITL